MSELALHAALNAYEADLSRPKHNRGTCIEMRASARQAAIEAFRAFITNDSKAEGLLAAAEYHDYLADGWHVTARHYGSMPDGGHWELSLELEAEADALVPLHRGLANDFRLMAVGEFSQKKPPFSF